MASVKILAHSYAFPPMAYPRSIQVPRLLKSLDAEIIVICGENASTRQDLTIYPEISEELDQIIRVPFQKNFILKAADSVAYRLGMNTPQLPDDWRTWNLQIANDIIKGYLRLSFEPDVLITFGQPMSDHLLGLTYKKDTNIPWIAHFSDPWVDNPYRQDNFLTKWVNRRWEKMVIEKADAIIFTSPETLDLVMKKYPSAWQKKAHYIPHSYDSILYDEEELPNDNKYVVRSIGNFYGNRSPEPFYKAIEHIVQENVRLLYDVNIELVGSASSLLLEKYPAATNYIKQIGYVPYIDSIQLMQTAHCLVVIDAPAQFSVFLPSKLADYIGANRFVFAISPPGRTRTIVDELGGLSADPTDLEAIVDCLEQILSQRPSNLSSSTVEFTQTAVGKKMKSIISQIV